MRSYTLVLVAALGCISARTPALADGGTTSDERPPVVCDPGRFLSRVECKGSYCDDITITCQNVPNVKLGFSYWSEFFSEENTGPAGCVGNFFIAGLACKGDYCDDVALYCVEITNLKPPHPNCSPPDQTFSEEPPNNFQDFTGHLSNKAHCYGSNCDNMSFDVCDSIATQP